MRTISIDISDSEFLKYNFQEEKLSFTDLVEKISIELAKQALRKCQEIAEKTGLSQLSLEEINAEIQAVRNAKSNT
jgi:Glu-tRNA(Gln) amidotransferase subunit E-like FAD-binding protein